MNRRGILGRMLAAPLAARVAGAEVAQSLSAASGMPLQFSRGGYDSGEGSEDAKSACGSVPQPWSPAQKKAWNLFSSMREERERSQQRKILVAEMLGGLPPHLASMRSNAPWFRAQRAAAWQDQLQEETKSYGIKLRDQVLKPLGLGKNLF